VREYIDTVLATRISTGKGNTVPLIQILFFCFFLHLLLPNNKCTNFASADGLDIYLAHVLFFKKKKISIIDYH
jgi:hypothetical protein